MFLELKEITKTFGQTVANDHISFGLEKGEILAVIGIRKMNLWALQKEPSGLCT